MQNLFHHIPTGENPPHEINVIIEISEGSFMKYEYRHDLGVLALDRVLHAPMPFPVNYGFIPQCWNDDDHDPSDAMVIASYPITPGVLVPCRVIGYFSMIDSGEKDEKVVCVPMDDPKLKHVENIEGLAPHYIKQIEFYFSTYKQIQNKVVEVKGFFGKDVAAEHIEKGMKIYKEKFAQ